MKIDEVMSLILAFGEDYENGSPTDINLSGAEIHAAIEQYGKEERERAHNAGFVEASRIYGSEIEHLRETIKEERKITATKLADKCQSDLDNYIAAHKLEWDKTNEAVRDTLEAVIEELRGGE